MTKVINLGKDFLHLFITRSQGLSKVLLLSGRCHQNSGLISSTAENLWLTPLLRFLKFNDSLLPNTTSFPILRILFPRLSFCKLTLWKSPSQRPFLEDPELRHYLFVPNRDPGSWGVRHTRLEVEAFEWAPALLELLLPLSHGQCEGSCSPQGDTGKRMRMSFIIFPSALPRV